MKKLSVVLLVLIVLVAGAVVGVPWLVRDQLTSNLSEVLGQPVAIRDLELNPFKGTLLIGTVEIGERTRIGKIAALVEMRPLIDRRVVVTSLEIDGVTLPVAIEGDNITIADYTLPPATEEASPAEGPGWTIVLEAIALRNLVSEFILDSAEYNIDVATLDVGGFVSDLSHPIDFSLDASVNEARLNTSGEVLIESSSTSVSGSLVLQNAALADYEALIPVDVLGTVELRGEMSTTIGDPFWLVFDGTTSVTDFSLTDIAMERIKADAVDWLGKLEVAVTGGQLSKLSVTGTSGVDRLALEPHATIGRLAVEEMSVDASSFAAASVTAEGVSAPPFGDVESVSVTQTAASVTGFSADSVSARNANIAIVRDADGAIEGLPEPSAEEEEPSSSGFKIDVATLEILQADIVFLDRSVSPEVNLEFESTDLVAQNLSDPGPTTFKLNARHAEQQDESETITVDGSLSLLSSPVVGNVNVAISRFDLHQIDSYIGGGITSGRLKMTSEVTMAEDVIEANNDVEIVGIKVDKRVADANASSQEMPISLALSLLKDKNGRIKLNVPVSSSREEFKVDTSDIVNTALGNATRKAAINYAKFALQPFGSLLLAKDFADMISRPRFEPVVFDPATVALTDESVQYIEKLSGMLLDRPEIQITVCGMATRLDLPEEPEESEELEELEEPEDEEQADDVPAEESEPVLTPMALAEERGHAVRKAIVATGVHDERILSCAPDVLDDDSAPRVEISL